LPAVAGRQAFEAAGRGPLGPLGLPVLLSPQADRLRFLLQHHHLAQIDGAGAADDLADRGKRRLLGDEGTREGVDVAVDAQAAGLLVGQLPAGRIQRQLAGQIAHPQQIGQRIVQAGRVIEGGDAVVEQLTLRLDGLHELDVLLGDDGVVAAHILQAEQPGGVGVEGLGRPRALEGAHAPGLTGLARLVRLLLQKGHAGRRHRQQLGIDGRVEAPQHQPEVQQQKQQRRGREEG